MSTIFALLVVVLGIINVTNFVLVAQEADEMTLRLLEDANRQQQEAIVQNTLTYRDGGDMGGGTGPGSQEMMESMRYFIFDGSSNTFKVFKMSAYTEETALSWAQSLLKGAPVGWSKTTYRYRVSHENNTNYLVVMDQSRELNPSYRILITSLIASLIGMVAMFAVIFFVSKWIIKPIEDADNKQKRFIADAALALKTPVSVISIDNATLVNKNGENDMNKSIKHQVNKLLDLSNDLNTLASIDKSGISKAEFNLSNVMLEIANQYQYAFADNKKELNSDIQKEILYNGDSSMFRKLISELFENALKYTDSEANVSLRKENERIIIEFANDSKGIPEGTLDRVFEKFYRLDYKDHSIYDGSGVGLSIVKEIVDSHKGRILAKGENDNFIIKIEL